MTFTYRYFQRKENNIKKKKIQHYAYYAALLLG